MIDNIIGKKIDMLTINKMVYKKNYIYYYECKCDCGNVTIKSKTYLTRKMKGLKNCGCLYLYNGANVSKDRLYRVYSHMLQRCHYIYNDRHKKYYQDKGIKVCDEWRNNFFKFKEWALVNGYDYNAPQGKCTIDRINPNGDYEPNNCRWITKSENSGRVAKKKGVFCVNDEQKQEIKMKRKNGYKMKELSKEYKISIPTIRKILKGDRSE